MSSKIVIAGKSVTPQDVEKSVVKEEYTKLGKKITVCHMTLSNGYEVIGYSGVVDESLYNKEIGERVARDKALNEVWSHLGSILQNQIFDSEYDKKCEEYVEFLRGLVNRKDFDTLEVHIRKPKIFEFLIRAVKNPTSSAQVHIQYVKENGEVIRKKL